MPESYTPIASGYNWRAGIAKLIRSEKAEVELVTALSKVAATPETHRILNSLLASKVERISALYELLDYRE